MRGRAQTATEYIIIIAVVIVIALVAAVVLGVFPGIGGEVDNKAEEYELTTNPVSIDGIGATDDETRLVIRNNFVRNIDVNDLSVEGKSCTTTNLPRTLKVGQKSLVSCTNINNSLVQDGFVPSVSVLWCDSLLEKAFTFTEGSADANFTYNGTCGAATTATSGSSGGFTPPTPPPPQVSSCNALGSTGPAPGVFYDGDGSLGNPYGICNCTMLQNMTNISRGNFSLLSNIDCSITGTPGNKLYNGGLGFEPVFNFTGTFDGGNYTIQNLYINRGSGSALFSMVNGSTIKDTGLVSPDITGSLRTAAFVGEDGSEGGLFTKLDEVYVTDGDVESSSVFSGGLVGRSEGFIEINDSAYLGNVTSSSTMIGGLIGYTYSGSGTTQITNSFFGGNVSGVTYIGGFIGRSNTTIIVNSNVNANITADASYSGGFLGAVTGGVIKNSNSSGNLDGNFGSGGILGDGEAVQGGTVGFVINDSHSFMSVDGTSSVGGIIGRAQRTIIRNSTSNGYVNGTGTLVGGLIGASKNFSVIKNSNNSGEVLGSSTTGGIAGEITNMTRILFATNRGNVSGTKEVGGIVGTGYGGLSKVDNAMNFGNVSGTGDVGGLIGRFRDNSSELQNSTNQGSVTSSRTNVSGGIGRAGDLVEVFNVTNNGTVNGTAGTVGGIAGYAINITITASRNLGNIFSGGVYTGGILGTGFDNDIIRSYNLGTVNSTSLSVGGILGEERLSSLGRPFIRNSFSNAKVEGTTRVGGLTGSMDYYHDVENSYAAGKVEATTGSSSGLVQNGNGGLITNSFNVASVFAASAAAGVASDQGGIGLNIYWFNDTSDDAEQCHGNGNAGCLNRTPLSYFYNHSAAPMNLWDFASIWDNASNKTGLPTLQ